MIRLLRSRTSIPGLVALVALLILSGFPNNTLVGSSVEAASQVAQAASPSGSLGPLANDAGFSFAPSISNVAAGSPNFTVDIVVNAGSNALDGAEAHITFDATKVQVVDAVNNQSGVNITPGSTFGT